MFQNYNLCRLFSSESKLGDLSLLKETGVSTLQVIRDAFKTKEKNRKEWALSHASLTPSLSKVFGRRNKWQYILTYSPPRGGIEKSIFQLEKGGYFILSS